MIVLLKKILKSRASAKIIMILIKIRLFDVVNIGGEKSTNDHYMRFKVEQTKNYRMREIHKFRTFVVNEKRHELDNDDRFDCLRHVTREMRLQQIQNLQHIILNVQFGDNVENDDDEMIFVTTYLKDLIRI